MRCQLQKGSSKYHYRNLGSLCMGDSVPLLNQTFRFVPARLTAAALAKPCQSLVYSEVLPLKKKSKIQLGFYFLIQQLLATAC